MTSGEVAEEVLHHDFHGSFRHPVRRLSGLRCKYADVGVGTDFGKHWNTVGQINKYTLLRCYQRTVYEDLEVKR